jgi:hypothetical protein
LTDEQPSEKEVVLLLHAVMYAFEEASREIDKRILFYVSQKIPVILGKFGFNIDKNKSPTENVNSILDLLRKTGYIEQVEFKELDDRTFELVIGKCAMAETDVHDILSPKRAFCPYSIIVASILQELFDENVVLFSSELTDKGSVTIIKRYKHTII